MKTEKKTVKRVLSIIVLLFILLLIILLLYLSFTGADHSLILAALFCQIVVPVLIYVFIWITNLVKK